MMRRKFTTPIRGAILRAWMTACSASTVEAATTTTGTSAWSRMYAPFEPAATKASTSSPASTSSRATRSASSKPLSNTRTWATSASSGATLSQTCRSRLVLKAQTMGTRPAAAKGIEGFLHGSARASGPSAWPTCGVFR